MLSKKVLDTCGKDELFDQFLRALEGVAPYGPQADGQPQDDRVGDIVRVDGELQRAGGVGILLRSYPETEIKWLLTMPPVRAFQFHQSSPMPSAFAPIEGIRVAHLRSHDAGNVRRGPRACQIADARNETAVQFVWPDFAPWRRGRKWQL